MLPRGKSLFAAEPRGNSCPVIEIWYRYEERYSEFSGNNPGRDIRHCFEKAHELDPAAIPPELS